MTYVNMIVVNYKENSSNFIYNGQNDKIREREREKMTLTLGRLLGRWRLIA